MEQCPHYESELSVNMHSNSRTDSPADRGFTMVELLVVIVILGILAALMVFTVRGVTDRASRGRAPPTSTTIEKAADAYMAQNPGRCLPASAPAPTAIEQFLVDAGMIRQVSTYCDLAADGTVTTTGEPCP